MLEVNFTMIYIIHKISASLKITKILKRCLRSVKEFYVFIKIINFFRNRK